MSKIDRVHKCIDAGAFRDMTEVFTLASLEDINASQTYFLGQFDPDDILILTIKDNVLTYRVDTQSRVLTEKCLASLNKISLPMGVYLYSISLNKIIFLFDDVGKNTGVVSPTHPVEFTPKMPQEKPMYVYDASSRHLFRVGRYGVMLSAILGKRFLQGFLGSFSITELNKGDFSIIDVDVIDGLLNAYLTRILGSESITGTIKTTLFNNIRHNTDSPSIDENCFKIFSRAKETVRMLQHSYNDPGGVVLVSSFGKFHNLGTTLLLAANLTDCIERGWPVVLTSDASIEVKIDMKLLSAKLEKIKKILIVYEGNEHKVLFTVPGNTHLSSYPIKSHLEEVFSLPADMIEIVRKGV